MLFARSMAMACLTVLKAMCWFTGALLLALTIVQYVRGDADARPYVTIATGVAFMAAGFAASWGARRFEGKA
jgi:ABC-type transport system involved in cytochrome bd biosynthesis fused ATPase/permease subunit